MVGETSRLDQVLDQKCHTKHQRHGSYDDIDHSQTHIASSKYTACGDDDALGSSERLGRVVHYHRKLVRTGSHGLSFVFSVEFVERRKTGCSHPILQVFPCF